MIVETRDYKKVDCDIELEYLMGLLPEKRKDSSFYNHDRPDYSALREKNEHKHWEVKNG